MDRSEVKVDLGLVADPGGRPYVRRAASTPAMRGAGYARSRRRPEPEPVGRRVRGGLGVRPVLVVLSLDPKASGLTVDLFVAAASFAAVATLVRSEEHTSELQSRQ